MDGILNNPSDPEARAMSGRVVSVEEWVQKRSYRAEEFEPSDLVASKEQAVSVVLPTLNVEQSLPRVLDAVLSLTLIGLVDEVIVIDGASTDGTVDIARRAGVPVVAESELLESFGPGRGKGDAMWRALQATTGDIVAYVDTDTSNFEPAYVVGLLGPLITDGEIDLVKGAFERPFIFGSNELAAEGGRVTELVARPLLNLYAPELTGFRQPLAGETAARRNLLESLAFPVGYGVEIAILIDTFKQRGLYAMAQSDLGERRNRHQPLRDLGAMAYAVMVAAQRRFTGDIAMPPDSVATFVAPTIVGLDVRSISIEERPPFREVAS